MLTTLKLGLSIIWFVWQFTRTKVRRKVLYCFWLLEYSPEYRGLFHDSYYSHSWGVCFMLSCSIEVAYIRRCGFDFSGTSYLGFCLRESLLDKSPIL
jgi:hypothetical protein